MRISIAVHFENFYCKKKMKKKKKKKPKSKPSGKNPKQNKNKQLWTFVKLLHSQQINTHRLNVADSSTGGHTQKKKTLLHWELLKDCEKTVAYLQ